MAEGILFEQFVWFAGGLGAGLFIGWLLCWWWWVLGSRSGERRG